MDEPTDTCASCCAPNTENTAFCTRCGAPAFPAPELAEGEPVGNDPDVPPEPPGSTVSGRRRTAALVGSAAATLVITVALAGVVIAGRGKSGSDSEHSRAAARRPNTAATRPVETAPPTTTTTLPPAPTLADGTTASGGVWTLSGQSSASYSGRAEIRFGAPRKLDQAGLTTATTFSSTPPKPLKACLADPFVDAIIPVQAVVTNTTEGFPSIVGLRLSVSTLSRSNLGVASDERFSSSGPVCEEAASNSNRYLYGVRSTDALSTNSSFTSDFYIVVRDYYTPARPGGDIEGLRQLVLDATITFGPDFTSAVTQQLSGPTDQTSPSMALRSPTR